MAPVNNQLLEVVKIMLILIDKDYGWVHNGVEMRKVFRNVFGIFAYKFYLQRIGFCLYRMRKNFKRILR